MEQLKYLKEINVIFEKFLHEFGGEIIPCTQEEIDVFELMLSNSYRLPAAYKEFLLYGGKKMGKLFEGGFSFSYKMAKFQLEHKNQDILKMIQVWNKESQLSPDIFVLTQHLTSYFDYFKLTEGENPPVYSWCDEDEGGLEVAQKEYDSFSDYLREQIRISAIELKKGVINKIEAKNPPRGQQFWVPSRQEITQGIDLHNLIRYFGFYSLNRLEQATSICGLDSDSYLEELSGWQARQVDGEMRFFPPKA
jgi:hypothetical protein